jgi:hypothetical protein
LAVIPALALDAGVGPPLSGGADCTGVVFAR